MEPNHPWVAWAYQEMSKGIRRQGSNPRILDYFNLHTDNIDKPVIRDNLDWCSAFMSSAFEESRMRSPRSVVARHWLRWGEPTEFKPGAVVVFWRVNPSSWQGHVGIALEDLGATILTLGGNQLGKVGINRYLKSQLLGFRWPSNYSLRDYYGLDPL